MLLVAGTALADTSASQTGRGWGHGMGTRPAVVGQITAINGSSLSVESKRFGKDEDTGGVTSTIYAVDASGATIYKNGSTVSLSDVVVGDFVAVQGTVSGATVTATEVRGGIGPRAGMRRSMPGMEGWRAPGTAAIAGNGQPVIGGTVGAVDASVVIVNTASGNLSYNVDVANATVMKRGATSTPSDIAVGDRVVVQGSVSGTSVTASSVIDHGAVPASTNTNTSGNTETTHRGIMGGFFGAIGGFFQHIFGFF